MAALSSLLVGGALVGGLVQSNQAAGAAQEAANLQASAGQEQQAFLQQGIDQIAQQLGVGRSDILNALNTSGRALTQGQQQQQQIMRPFQLAGEQALGQQQALLGLGSPEQQQAAFAAFQESPGQRFIREQAERATLRNAAATGRLGGGEVQAELARLGAGFAAQDFGNQFNRLNQLRLGGQQAASQLGAGALGIGQQRAQNRLNVGFNLANLGQGASTNIASILGAQGRAAQDIGAARASGVLGAQQAQAQGFQNLLQTGATAASMFSDPKLKTNIKRTGSKNGLNWYSWDWSETAKTLGLVGSSEGVMADEVKRLHPECITEEAGYMKVNYQALGVL